MKPRAPFILVAIVVLAVIAAVFYMLAPDTSFLMNPIFIATLIIAFVLLLINNSLGKLIDAEKFKTLSEEEKAEYIELVKIPYIKRLLNSAFKRSKEEESGEVAILDHGYDGILELDNKLPRWWVGLLYITIVYAFIYLIAVGFTDFAHPDVEYNKEFEKQKAEIAEYEKTKPQATLETAKYNPDLAAEGKEIYNNICKTCHGEGATGGSGPNQTDDFWINIVQQDEFKNIFEIASNGSPSNPTMRGFVKTGELKGNDIEKVASYLVKLNQETKKNADGSSKGKAPQGTLAPWATEGTPGTKAPATAN